MIWAEARRLPCVLCWFNRRRLRAYRGALRGALTLCLGVAVLAALSGCTDGYHQLNPLGTPFGPQTITLRGSANGVVHSATASVIVQ